LRFYLLLRTVCAFLRIKAERALAVRSAFIVGLNGEEASKLLAIWILFALPPTLALRRFLCRRRAYRRRYNKINANKTKANKKHSPPTVSVGGEIDYY
jgi:hypothetical protein